MPSSYSGEEAVPLVLSFHGWNGTAEEQASRGLPAKGDEAGFIVVTPQANVLPAVPGFINVANPGWDQYVSGHEEPNALVPGDWPVDYYGPDHENASVAFVDDLLDSLEVSLCIDKDRV